MNSKLVLVPLEPTPQMIEAAQRMARNHDNCSSWVEKFWRVMVQASQVTPTPANEACEALDEAESDDWDSRRLGADERFVAVSAPPVAEDEPEPPLGGHPPAFVVESAPGVDKPEMPAATLTALQGSIAKWQAIVDGTGEDLGSRNCPLCQMFLDPASFDDPCKGCPVYERTGMFGCEGSPYEAWRDRRDGPAEERERLAQAELDFLESLLPEGAPRTVDVTSVNLPPGTVSVPIDPPLSVVRRFICRWRLGYEPEDREVDASFFTRSNGFDQEDIDAILGLGVGMFYVDSGFCVERLSNDVCAPRTDPPAHAADLPSPPSSAMTTTTSFTPGPWYVSLNPYRVGHRAMLGAPMVLVAECGVRIGLTEDGAAHKSLAPSDEVLALEAQANARLIAQAPRMHEALDIAAATIELFTGNGAQTQPKNWPRTPNGDIDMGAVAKLLRSILADVAG